MTSLRGHHDFRLLWIGQTVSQLGASISSFAFPLLGFALTGSTLLASTIGAVHLLGLVLTLLPAGVLADRVDKRRLMRGALLAGTLGYASLAAALATGAPHLAHLLAVAFVGGVAAGLFDPAESAAVRQVVTREQLPAALSLNQARQHVASLTGGPLGGLLYGLTRWAPFLADAASYALAWLLLGRLRTDLGPAPRPADEADAPAGLRALRHELAQGLVFVWRHPFMRVLTLWSASANLAINTLFGVAVLRLVTLGVHPFRIGLVETAAGLAGIVGAVLAPRIIERTPTGALTVLIAWTPVPLLVPMALWPHPAVVGAGVALVLLPNAAGNAGIGAYRTLITPDHLLARVQSAMQLASMSVMPLSPLLAGLLLEVLPGTVAVLATGLVCALSALVPTLSRTVRSVPRPDRWPTSPEVATVAT
ncbi:MFS transporter [Nocardioides bruguierae]|uniref:MFS transporter n=1 Tax=Nocardioides bruguierae TaxID=2945102 RepID=A0A9X2DB11_9ACTN|nr:MFS transporter [Nocardioides bruguierae]MCM0622400.1 MFS transporter [Nocardioides bruguierae]